ncbi:MAG: hypothetical protein J0L93_01795 [Deltaproteobacteria bacterium]|nr:hypothetical protein [Deltaproteobacteria bacterium]
MRSQIEIRKKTTVEIPESLLREALRISGKSINETVSLGLRLVAAREASEDLLSMFGTYKSTFNFKKLRDDK